MSIGPGCPPILPCSPGGAQVPGGPQVHTRSRGPPAGVLASRKHDSCPASESVQPGSRRICSWLGLVAWQGPQSTRGCPAGVFLTLPRAAVPSARLCPPLSRQDPASSHPPLLWGLPGPSLQLGPLPRLRPHPGPDQAGLPGEALTPRLHLGSELHTPSPYESLGLSGFPPPLSGFKASKGGGGRAGTPSPARALPKALPSPESVLHPTRPAPPPWAPPRAEPACSVQKAKDRRGRCGTWEAAAGGRCCSASISGPGEAGTRSIRSQNRAALHPPASSCVMWAPSNL